ncbi:MAG: hypothetical protein H6733_12955 [Alphaproteobacteria bacterium]|nr:hypothetical protein [Alphaproteobacteria bacterium]
MRTLLWPALALVPLVAHAEDLPSHFVSADDCHPRECTCADGPMVELFLSDQTAARDAWIAVRVDIMSPGGPATPADAIADFQGRFAGDSRIADQFRSCTGYDPAVNKLTKIAGVSGIGQARLDPCFCDAFCADIVSSTVSHELMHVPTVIAGVVGRGDMLVACKVGILSGAMCDALLPLALADSEIAAHQVGVVVLDNAVDDIHDLDPDGDGPRTRCTWDALTPQTDSAGLDVPDDLGERAWTLWDRIVHGSARQDR